MREPNLCFPSHNKAAVCITSALYDRRALDCTASLPLINSLTHLAYLTSTSPRIREILVLDGGLERLVRILSPEYLAPERRSLWKWSLAFQCVVNVGVRGTEQFRTKVVDAGMIPIVLRVLENFLRALELVRQENDRKDTNPLQHNPYQQQQQQVMDTVLSPLNSSHEPVTFPPVMTNNSTTVTTTMIPTTESGHPQSPRQQHRILRKSTFPYIKMTAAQRRRNRLNREPTKTVPTWQDPREPNIDNVFYREEDILLSLQLLAYLSKYPHIRNQFHNNYDRNVFSVVERFCHRLHPNPIQYWAGVIMRNACRKDETKGGTRRCANMHCGKWESQPREFAKCRRCRKAKYCCKACQSKAWADGHRWWCVERHATVPPPQDALTTTTAANTTIATTATATTITAATATATTSETTTTTNTEVNSPTPPTTTPTPMPTGIINEPNIDSTESSDSGQESMQQQNNDSTTMHHQFDRVRRHHYRHLLSSPVSTVPTLNSPDRRPSSTGQHQDQQDQSSASPILVNNINLPSSTHGNMSIIEQEHSPNGSAETSDNHNAILMDVGVQMET